MVLYNMLSLYCTWSKYIVCALIQMTCLVNIKTTLYVNVHLSVCSKEQLQFTCRLFENNTYWWQAISFHHIRTFTQFKQRNKLGNKYHIHIIMILWTNNRDVTCKEHLRSPAVHLYYWETLPCPWSHDSLSTSPQLTTCLCIVDCQR